MSRWHQSSSPNAQASASHPPIGPHDHILPTSSSNATLKDLHLQLRPHKSQSRVWQDDTPTPTEEIQCTKKQIRFKVEEDLGDNPTLPPDLTTFLVVGMAKEQDDTPSPSIPLPLKSHGLPQQRPPVLSYLHGRAQAKVPAKPSAA